MTEVVAFPDAEAVVVAYLRAALSARGDTVRVSTKIPATRPPRLVRVTRVGGARRNVSQDDATVVVECWAADTDGASELARTCRALLGAMEVPAAFVPQDGEVSGPQFFPDPLTSDPRYQFTVIVRLRAQLLEA
jgi:hypothetical protein